MRNPLAISSLTILFTLPSVSAYAGELEGFGEDLIASLLIWIIFLASLILMFRFFKDNRAFTTFSIINLFLFFFINIMGDAISDQTTRFAQISSYFQIAAQFIAILWATKHHLEHRSPK